MLQRTSERHEIRYQPPSVRLLGIVRIRRWSAGKLQSHFPLRGIVVLEGGRIRIMPVHAVSGRLQRCQDREFRRIVWDRARRVAFGPEIAEQVVSQYRAQTMGDDDNSIVVVAVVDRSEQVETAFA